MFGGFALDQINDHGLGVVPQKFTGFLHYNRRVNLIIED
jgi:hypothetical protein